MKNLVLLFALMFASFVAIGQNLSSNSITLVDAGGGNFYMLDSVVYSNGLIVINRTANQDSAAMAVSINADSTSSVTSFNTSNRAYSSDTTKINTVNANLATLEAKKVVDSLAKGYWTTRIAQLSIVLDSLAAN